MTSTIRNLPTIVEQGTSGIWTYRKWSDGIAEVWGRQSQSISANSSNANVYVSYPFTFAVDPLMTSVALGGGGSRDSHVHQIPLSDGTARTRIRLFYSNTYTATVSISANMYIVGRWK